MATERHLQVTGTPFTVTASSTSLNAPGNTQTADQVLPEVKILGGTRAGQSYFDPLAFRSITDVRYGNSGLNTLRGPGVVNLDLGLFREFRVRDLQIQFRAEAFNATNTPHFNNPGANVSSMRLNADGTVNSLGGYTEITSAKADERQVRLGDQGRFLGRVNQLANSQPQLPTPNRPVRPWANLGVGNWELGVGVWE